jgi:hypothetical protein
MHFMVNQSEVLLQHQSSAAADTAASTQELQQQNLPGQRQRRVDESVVGENTATATTFGDIMSVGGGLVMDMRQQQQLPKTNQTTTTATTTTTTSSLADMYGITNPLDRLCLTANGNLQRLVSSYYDAPVSVVVEKCCQRRIILSTSDDKSRQQQPSSTMIDVTTATPTPPPQIWDRVVHLSVYNRTFCTATSVVTVHCPLCQQLVESGKVGLGQLFRYLDLLPMFELHQAGVHNDSGFWRDYTLYCAELSCRIHEDFCAGMWELQPAVSIQYTD